METYVLFTKRTFGNVIVSCHSYMHCSSGLRYRWWLGTLPIICQSFVWESSKDIYKRWNSNILQANFSTQHLSVFFYFRNVLLLGTFPKNKRYEKLSEYLPKWAQIKIFVSCYSYCSCSIHVSRLGPNLFLWFELVSFYINSIFDK
jgi:hypothetical protein